MASEPDDNPEWTDEDFRRGKPARDVHGEAVALQLTRPVGRPAMAVGQRKERVTIRLSPEVLAYFRESGPGWQTRLDETLRGTIRKG